MHMRKSNTSQGYKVIKKKSKELDKKLINTSSTLMNVEMQA